MRKAAKPRVVIDTNIFISGIILKAKTTPYLLLQAWRKNKYTVVLSDELFDEIADVLRREKIYKKYHISREEREVFLVELRNSTRFVQNFAGNDISVDVRDPQDKKVLLCALAGECDYLITGDDDLLVLNGEKSIGSLKIVKAAEFLSKEGLI